MSADVHTMKKIAPTVAAVLGLKKPGAAAESPIDAMVADLAGSCRLAILAPDALGILPWRLWRDRMPFLSSLHDNRSLVLESVMPPITPVNFACMLTGAELAVHGIDKPYQRDDGWIDFQCETLYDVVRDAGGQSAGAGQQGYTGELLLARCADLAWVAERGPAATVSALIESKYDDALPMFLIAQFGNVDSTFHRLGPSDPEVVPMLEELDHTLQGLTEFLTRAGTDIIFLADHGQHDILDPAQSGKRGAHNTDTPEDRQVPCTWVKA